MKNENKKNQERKEGTPKHPLIGEMNIIPKGYHTTPRIQLCPKQF